MSKHESKNDSITDVLRNACSSRTALYLLLIFFGILYTLYLNVNGFANEYYSAAAQAGAHSWKAFLYGTSDFNANITVDKPPASLWLPSLCIRIFGLSPWSILLPEVFMLLLSIRLLYTHIERHFDTLTAWITSFLFASTPLIFIMFRYNNPEALMTLLIIAMATTTDKALIKKIKSSSDNKTQSTVREHVADTKATNILEGNSTDDTTGTVATTVKAGELKEENSSDTAVEIDASDDLMAKSKLKKKKKEKNLTAHGEHQKKFKVTTKKIPLIADLVPHSEKSTVEQKDSQPSKVSKKRTKKTTSQELIPTEDYDNQLISIKPTEESKSLTPMVFEDNIAVWGKVLKNIVKRDTTIYHNYRWAFFTGILAGFAFLTKQLEALMSLPALIITLIIFFPFTWRKKIIALSFTAIGLLLGASWWVALIEFTPKGHRPYIGGSPMNDFLELTLSFNGLGRIMGDLFNSFTPNITEFLFEEISELKNQPGSYEFPGLSPSEPGIARFFHSPEAKQINWLLGVSMIGILVFVWFFFIRKQASRGQKALITNWTLTLATMFPIFTFMGVAFHVYYPVIMAPAIAILSGILLGFLWRERKTHWAKEIALCVLIIIAVQYYINFHYENNYLRFGGLASVLLASIAALLIVIYWFFSYKFHWFFSPPKYLAHFTGIITFIAVCSGPLALSVSSIRVPQLSGLPAAGPESYVPQSILTTPAKEEARSKVVKHIKNNGNRFLWVAAIVGKESSYFQLRSEYSVLPIGGFTGLDNNVPLKTLQKFIYDSKIHYFIVPSDSYANLFPNNALLIDYVKKNYSVQQFGTDPDYTYDLYDLTKHR